MKTYATTAIVALAGLTLLTTDAFALSPSDAWITTKAKTAVAADLGTTAGDVNVDTVDGVITLHGKVRTDEEKAQAEEAASGLDGVREVKNLLQVVPADEAEGVAESDARIHEEVKRALAKHDDLGDSQIDVASVNRGTVLLSGRADSSSDHDLALEVAGEVPGVVEVHSEMRGPGPREALEQEGSSLVQGARDLAGTVTDTASDAWIATTVKSKLLARDETPGLDIDVEAEDGTVTLKGVVPSTDAKAAAEAEAETVRGVQRVDNQLEVSELEDEAEDAE